MPFLTQPRFGPAISHLSADTLHTIGLYKSQVQALQITVNFSIQKAGLVLGVKKIDEHARLKEIQEEMNRTMAMVLALYAQINGLVQVFQRVEDGEPEPEEDEEIKEEVKYEVEDEVKEEEVKISIGNRVEDV